MTRYERDLDRLALEAEAYGTWRQPRMLGRDASLAEGRRLKRRELIEEAAFVIAGLLVGAACFGGIFMIAEVATHGSIGAAWEHMAWH